MTTHSKPPSLMILATGGTFDKWYDVVDESMGFEGESNQSIVPSLTKEAMLENARVETIMLKDSFDMSSDDRNIILKAIEGCSKKRILIVHGTSTMIETGEYLVENTNGSHTIVLTGALKPFRYDPVEASANFGMAVAAARYMSSGIYIAMHGLVESPQSIFKDPDTGRFKLKTVSARRSE